MPKIIRPVETRPAGEATKATTEGLAVDVEQLKKYVSEQLVRLALAMNYHGHRHDEIRGGWARGIFKTFEDPETFSTETIGAIPAGTIIVREGVTPRRVYFMTQSGLHRLIASGTTGAADGHSHAITDVDIDFKIV